MTYDNVYDFLSYKQKDQLERYSSATTFQLEESLAPIKHPNLTLEFDGDENYF